MASAPKIDLNTPPVKRLSVKDWTAGVVTRNSDGRTPLSGLKAGGNVYLEEDGVVRPRPSLIRYGPQPTGKVLGQIFEYKKVTGLITENWMVCMQSFLVSASPSASLSPSSSSSPSASSSRSPSSSLSPSASSSSSASSSRSPSSSLSPSASLSPSSSSSKSLSPSASLSPSSSASNSPSSSSSPSASLSPSTSVSASPSAPTTAYGQIFIARGEDLTWTAVSGKYYDTEAKAHFFQIANKVVIMNGVDNLSYLDIASATVVPFTALTTPAQPTVANNGTTDLTTGGFLSMTYRVTANSTAGETAASNASTATLVNLDRDSWDPSKHSLKVTWTAVSNAVSYNVYLGNNAANSEYLIASNLNGLSFIDDGTFGQDTTRLYPTTNSTAGPKTSRGANIGGRAFMVGDKDNPYYVWFGGDFGHELDFSPANGGGNQPINSGGKELPNFVGLHRDGQGHAAIKVLAAGTNGKGKRFTLTPDSLTFGNTVISFYDVTEDQGEDGTESPDAVITYNDSLWYPSRDGIKTTGSLPQLQNVITTRRVSNTIQPDMANLMLSAMPGAVGLGFEGRLYFALPVNTSSNNEIWVLDLDRKGAWMKPWSISCDQMWLYNDNTGNTHQLILSNNVVYDLSRSALTTDNGVPFLTNGSSGEIYFSPDKRMWVQLLAVVIVLGRPQGEMNWQITGKTEDSNLQALGDATTFDAEVNTTIAGWGEINASVKGWGRNGWSQVTLVPTDSSAASQEILIEVDEEVQWAAYNWNTNKAGVDYRLSDVIFEYVETGIKDLS